MWWALRLIVTDWFAFWWAIWRCVRDGPDPDDQLERWW